MKKEYTLKGLDCANCAAKIETAVKRLEGVADASVTLMTATLKVEFTDEHADMLQRIRETAERLEPGIVLTEKE